MNEQGLPPPAQNVHPGGQPVQHVYNQTPVQVYGPGPGVPPGQPGFNAGPRFVHVRPPPGQSAYQQVHGHPAYFQGQLRPASGQPVYIQPNMVAPQHVITTNRSQQPHTLQAYGSVAQSDQNVPPPPLNPSSAYKVSQIARHSEAHQPVPVHRSTLTSHLVPATGPVPTSDASSRSAQPNFSHAQPSSLVHAHNRSPVPNSQMRPRHSQEGVPATFTTPTSYPRHPPPSFQRAQAYLPNGPRNAVSCIPSNSLPGHQRMPVSYSGNQPRFLTSDQIRYDIYSRFYTLLEL